MNKRKICICIIIFLWSANTILNAETPYTIAGSYPFLDMTSGAYNTLALYDLTSPYTQEMVFLMRSILEKN